MSLIPSESLSFPDDFSRAITRARALSEAKTTAALLNARSKHARARAVPPAPMEQPQAVPAPVVIAAPKPVATKTPPIKASIPAPVKMLAPKPVSTTLPGPVAQSPVVPAPVIIPAPKPVATKMPPIKTPIPIAEPAPAPTPIKTQAPKPVMAKAAPNEQLQQRRVPQPAPEAPQPIKLRPRALAAAPANGERAPKEKPLPPQPQRRQGPIRMVPKAPIAAPQVPSVPVAIEPAPEDTENERESRSLARIHGRGKWKRFILIESIALGVLIPAAASALSHYFTDPVAVLVMNILTIIAALVAGIVPILFFAIAPTLPRTER